MIKKVDEVSHLWVNASNFREDEQEHRIVIIKEAVAEYVQNGRVSGTEEMNPSFVRELAKWKLVADCDSRDICL